MNPAHRGGAALRGAALVAACAVLALVCLLSVGLGAMQMSPATVISAFLTPDDSYSALIVTSMRVPRTLVGLIAGAALGAAGALMQSMTRNPLADPGLLGVNAGAATAVVFAVAFLGLDDLISYVWFSFAGAMAISLLVYAISTAGRGGATPVRLALAGTAISVVLTSLIQAVLLIEPVTFDRYRFWAVGALAGRDLSVVVQVLPFVLIGLVIALLLAPSLNVLALGDDGARALGLRIGRTRVLGALAVTLLCGGATAAAGPIAFVGLAVPHMVRSFTGPDQRWLLPFSMVTAPILLLGADLAGRLLARPSELEVGLLTAALGAPVLMWLVRRRRIAQL
ncbi:iron chelate uptake ABC transporter family permease subunit [Nonomuraea sp. NPDC050404]|uniref:FecCD family ABC transporter permease n=1 Tax=Nonomuraea sp. NPDC050404 TaxID=3155783 RepID=UPI0033DB195C